MILPMQLIEKENIYNKDNVNIKIWKECKKMNNKQLNFLWAGILGSTYIGSLIIILYVAFT